MAEHPYGWLSTLPPLLAIALAMVTRRVIVSLLAGILAGTLILKGGDPLAAVVSAVMVQLAGPLIDPDKLAVFAFTLLMGAMVGLINRSGGMRGLIELITPWAKNRRRGELTAWILGLFIFFDDYANTVLLGSTLRPLCDRLKISREKLAYLVDSTAAPVAGLALISTWVAGEIQFVQDGLAKLPASTEWNAFDLFVGSIPYRFYVLWALLFVGMVAWSRRDFGPMRGAEAGGRERLSLSEEIHDPTAPDPATPGRWYNAVVPIVVTVLSIVVLLYVSGKRAAQPDEAGGQPSLWEIFGAADAFSSLVWGSLAGFLAAITLIGPQRLLAGRQLLGAIGTGGRLMIPALVILWLASALSMMTGGGAVPAVLVAGQGAKVERAESRARKAESRKKDEGERLKDEDRDHNSPSSCNGQSATRPFQAYPHRRARLYTGEYLGALLGGWLPVALLPTMVFVLSGFVAFATGTSWGTMGILMPLVIPLSYNLLVGADRVVTPDDPILLAGVGSVLAGAIFGDHCSPISDTTVLSSQASGCDHMAHVATQLPYALSVGGVAILCGTLPVGFGVPVGFVLPVGVLALAVILWLLAAARRD